MYGSFAIFNVSMWWKVWKNWRNWREVNTANREISMLLRETLRAASCFRAGREHLGSHVYTVSERAGLTSHEQGFQSRPVTGNRRGPVPVYRTGLTGYRSDPVEFKSKFKKIQKLPCNRFRPVYRPVLPVYRPVLPVYRSVWPVWIQIQIQKLPCNRFTGRFDWWALMGRPIFFLFLFWFNFKSPQTILNERIFEKIWYH